ncbi:unnamed protein product [marine sediment metagenome]|uniref:Uncharacterized protein n=1 Tax=marine sediment metagenome TaxID=412755 RepID=X1T647_9ZZZZ
MPRPKIRRCLRHKQNVRYFKPQGIPLRILEEVVLELDELEALKLHDIDGLEQVDAAKKMGISQSTFARTLDKVYKKLADGIINGKAIKIEDYV